MRTIKAVVLTIALIGAGADTLIAKDKSADQESSVAAGPQYGATHVYVAPSDLDSFVASLIATFGGTKSEPTVLQITPTPSQTIFQAVRTPVGIFSVFGFKTPIPFPFGTERVGYLVTDLDAAVRSAKAHNADLVVAPFDDPIGRDVIVGWPGGVSMQFYVHTIAPNYAKLQTIPENRIYVPDTRVDEFVRDFVSFSGGQIISDDRHALGIEIGRPDETYRRVRIDSTFGKMTVLGTDGHLPYPYGRETTGYEVADFPNTLTRAKAAGVTILVEPYIADRRLAAITLFPGGYIAEIHSSDSK
jgi:hypothetical protein